MAISAYKVEFPEEKYQTEKYRIQIAKMTAENFVKSPVVFRRKKSIRRRCSDIFRTKNLKKSEDLRSAKSEPILNRHSIFRRSLRSGSSGNLPIENAEPVRPRRNSILRRSIDNFNKTTKAFHRRNGKSNEDFTARNFKVKVEECLMGSIKTSDNSKPILSKNEILMEDTVIWEEDWKPRRA